MSSIGAIGKHTFLLSAAALLGGYLIGRWLRPAAPTVIGTHHDALPGWVS
jgi:hypothetical protein